MLTGNLFVPLANALDATVDQGNLSSTLPEIELILWTTATIMFTHCIPSWSSLRASTILEAGAAPSIQHHRGNCIVTSNPTFFKLAFPNPVQPPSSCDFSILRCLSVPNTYLGKNFAHWHIIGSGCPKVCIIFFSSDNAHTWWFSAKVFCETPFALTWPPSWRQHQQLRRRPLTPPYDDGNPLGKGIIIIY